MLARRVPEWFIEAQHLSFGNLSHGGPTGQVPSVLSPSKNLSPAQMLENSEFGKFVVRAKTDKVFVRLSRKEMVSCVAAQVSEQISEDQVLPYPSVCVRRIFLSQN